MTIGEKIRDLRLRNELTLKSWQIMMVFHYLTRGI